MKDCGRDHFKSSHGVFIKWRKERGEREKKKSPSRYRDRSKSREREKPHKKTGTKEEKKESNPEPMTGKYKKDNKTKRKIKIVEVTTDEETATETAEEERPSKPKMKKLRRVKERSATPRPRSSYYREILIDKDDCSEDEPKRTRRVKATQIRMVKESRERSDEEYNFLVRETFEDRGVNHDVTATVDTGAQQTVCGAERAKENEDHTPPQHQEHYIERCIRKSHACNWNWTSICHT